MLGAKQAMPVRHDRAVAAALREEGRAKLVFRFHRRSAQVALLGMVAVSAAYLLGGTLLRPDLWADPLGPFVKILPGAVLALAALAILDER